MRERESFIRAWESGMFNMTELCGHFRVSRKTGYKWLERYQDGGEAGLADRSRAPHSHPNRTPPEIEARIIELKRAKPKWGPKKIRARLVEQEPEVAWPAISTIGETLDREGLVEKRKKRGRRVHPGRPISEANEVNELWSSDFKGDIRLGDSSVCYPLTIQDRYSRFVIGCDGLVSTAFAGVQQAMERVFREYGLPLRIRTDNGIPFASQALAGLTQLNVWWMELGIVHERTKKARPDQNGAHERMHRDLKAATSRPPSMTLDGQQLRFDEFCREYNHERPHEGIGQKRPADLWEPSARPYPEKLVEPEYPGHFEVRRVRHGGEIRFKGLTPFISKALMGKRIGLEEIDDGIWSIYFINTLICRFDERTWKAVG